MIDYPRYLSAKKTVDDRALNRPVWDQLTAALAALPPEQPLRILEIGCGIGTMVERLMEWGLAARVDYLGIDSQAGSLQVALTRLPAWGQAHGFQVCSQGSLVELIQGDLHWRLRFLEAEFTHFCAGGTYQGAFDLLIAQAFLDLVDVPTALPGLRRLLSPGGLFYFTINFDGVTIFEPVTDPLLESQILQRYHHSMDERQVAERPSGDSRTGRHLFSHLRACGAHILAAGASDWVVYPGPAGYPAEEAYFLHCILDFFETTLEGCAGLDQDRLARWLAQRRRQIEQGELVYMAHQVDFLGAFTTPGR